MSGRKALLCIVAQLLLGCSGTDSSNDAGEADTDTLPESDAESGSDTSAESDPGETESGPGETESDSGEAEGDSGEAESDSGPPDAGRQIIGYLGYDLASDVRLDQLTSGVWEVVQPVSPWDMTLERADGGDIGDCAATLAACDTAGIPCLLSVYSPWDVAEYNDVFTSPSLAEALIDNIAAMVDDWGFDGVDLDWESDVQSNLDLGAFSQFIVDLRTALPPGKLIGTASSPTKVTFESWAADSFDYIGVMTYDIGSSATWYGTMADVESSMNLWADAGFPKSKLLLGISFAARYAAGGGWFSYASIVDTYDPPPSANAAGDLVFNGIDLVTEKAHWIEDNGFGGVFVYTVNLDKLDDPRSLLQHIYDTIGPP